MFGNWGWTSGSGWVQIHFAFTSKSTFCASLCSSYNSPNGIITIMPPSSSRYASANANKDVYQGIRSPSGTTFHQEETHHEYWELEFHSRMCQRADSPTADVQLVDSSAPHPSASASLRGPNQISQIAHQVLLMLHNQSASWPNSRLV